MEDMSVDLGQNSRYRRAYPARNKRKNNTICWDITRKISQLTVERFSKSVVLSFVRLQFFDLKVGKEEYLVTQGVTQRSV